MPLICRFWATKNQMAISCENPPREVIPYADISGLGVSFCLPYWYQADRLGSNRLYWGYGYRRRNSHLLLLHAL